MDKIDQTEVQEMEQGKDDITFIENTKEEKKLLRKIDLWMLPVIWILYLVSYMVTIVHCFTVAGLLKVD